MMEHIKLYCIAPSLATANLPRPSQFPVPTHITVTGKPIMLAMLKTGGPCPGAGGAGGAGGGVTSFCSGNTGTMGDGPA